MSTPPAVAQSAVTPPPAMPAPKAKLPDFKPGEQPRFEMVLIHGLGGAAAEWDQVEPYLKGTFKVASFELAGHGVTQPVMDPTVVTEAKRWANSSAPAACPTRLWWGTGWAAWWRCSTRWTTRARSTV